jgi:hypothetical protein
MIKWIKFDPKNPPKVGKYLIIDKPDEQFIYEARYVGENYTRVWRVVGGGFPLHVTHYAEINLPT